MRLASGVHQHRGQVIIVKRLTPACSSNRSNTVSRWKRVSSRAINSPPVYGRDSVLTLQLVVNDLDVRKANHMILEVASLTCRSIPHWHSDNQRLERIQRIPHSVRIGHTGSAIDPVSDRQGTVIRVVGIDVGSTIAWWRQALH